MEIRRRRKCLAVTRRYWKQTEEKEEMSMKQDMIVILDLGSTENAAMARRVRELGVYSEIHPHDILWKS